MLRSPLLGLRVRLGISRLVIKCASGISSSVTSSSSDEQLVTLNGKELRSFKVVDLQQELVKRKLKKSGRKHELIERLQAVLQEEHKASAFLVNGEPIDQLTIVQLRLHLFRRKLLSTGGRAEMTERLREYVTAHTDHIEETPASTEKQTRWDEKLEHMSPNISHSIYKASKEPVRKRPVTFQREKKGHSQQAQDQKSGDRNQNSSPRPNASKDSNHRQKNRPTRHANEDQKEEEYSTQRNGDAEKNVHGHNKDDVMEFEFPKECYSFFTDKPVAMLIKDLTGFCSAKTNYSRLNVRVGRVENVENAEAKVKDLLEKIVQYKKSEDNLQIYCPNQGLDVLNDIMTRRTLMKLFQCKLYESEWDKESSVYIARGKKDDLMNLQAYIDVMVGPAHDIQTRTALFKMNLTQTKKLKAFTKSLQTYTKCDIWINSLKSSSDRKVYVRGTKTATTLALELMKTTFGKWSADKVADTSTKVKISDVENSEAHLDDGENSEADLDEADTDDVENTDTDLDDGMNTDADLDDVENTDADLDDVENSD